MRWPSHEVLQTVILLVLVIEIGHAGLTNRLRIDLRRRREYLVQTPIPALESAIELVAAVASDRLEQRLWAMTPDGGDDVA